MILLLAGLDRGGFEFVLVSGTENQHEGSMPDYALSPRMHRNFSA
jgi:hypothetical protein